MSSSGKARAAKALAAALAAQAAYLQLWPPGCTAPQPVLCAAAGPASLQAVCWACCAFFLAPQAPGRATSGHRAAPWRMPWRAPAHPAAAALLVSAGVWALGLGVLHSAPAEPRRAWGALAPALLAAAAAATAVAWLLAQRAAAWRLAGWAIVVALWWPLSVPAGPRATPARPAGRAIL